MNQIKIVMVLVMSIWCYHNSNAMNEPLVPLMEQLKGKLNELGNVLTGRGPIPSVTIPTTTTPTPSIEQVPFTEQNTIVKGYIDKLIFKDAAYNLKNNIDQIYNYIKKIVPFSFDDFLNVEDNYVDNLYIIISLELASYSAEEKQALYNLIFYWTSFIDSQQTAIKNLIKNKNNINKYEKIRAAQKALEEQIFIVVKPTHGAGPSRPVTQQTTHDLIFPSAYLVNNENYAQYVPAEVPIKIGNNRLQQVLTISQFLTPDNLFITTNPQVIIDLIGLRMKKYIDFLLKFNADLPPQNPNIEDIVIGGGAAPSCAYQALRNCAILIEAFDARSNNEYDQKISQFYNLKNLNSLFGKPESNKLVGNPQENGKWREFIINRRISQHADTDNGDWLFAPEMKVLINNLLKRFINTIVVLEDMDDLKSSDSYERLKKELTQPNKIGGFILFHPSPDNPNGHWFALVVTTNAQGRKTFTIADSTNTPRYPKEDDQFTKNEFTNKLLDYIITDFNREVFRRVTWL